MLRAFKKIYEAWISIYMTVIIFLPVVFVAGKVDFTSSPGFRGGLTISILIHLFSFIISISSVILFFRIVNNEQKLFECRRKIEILENKLKSI